ncbi:uncharacterized protein DSM5745_09117 [Aspergillus mulundensis]|uniref:Rhodanese domain-containing protein n=1 Tax=Aspergillus mulundensis TaxID=1810919 RepID=A0A3D8R016_9EURO|nr:hypothetical protein DSM5745_09117 [Aspergillus mulundensis]RDW67251.1 hypothetical protein DSM5745_09117 [Aspergillus mulundensis]
MSGREGKAVEFGKEFHDEGKESQPHPHVETSTGGKVEVPTGDPQAKSDVEKLAEGFLDPEDDVGTAERSLSYEVRPFPTNASLKALELNIKDGELGVDITANGFWPSVDGMHATGRKGTGPFSLMHKVKVITPAEAAFYTSGNSAKIKREEIVIIDLRRKEDSATDETTGRVRGAKNWPLVDSSAERDNWYTNFDMQESAKTTVSRQKEVDVQNNWQALYNDHNSVVYQVAADPNVKHVVFHCYQSRNRTPAIARGYWQFMRKQGGRDEATAQKVYVMAGGYQAYTGWVTNAKYFVGRENWE